ncbi:MAG: Zn-dependent hydrolase [Bryobacteraceae bacterium]
MQTRAAVSLILAMGLTGCRQAPERKSAEGPTMKDKLAQYATVELKVDPAVLTEKERQMIPLLIDAARIMDGLFWQQAYGDKQTLLSKVKDPDTLRYVEINYGPWDRLDGNKPFVPGYGPKPPGANFYPTDMTKDQFESAASASAEASRQLRSLYTMVTRPEGGGLVAVPYHVAFAEPLKLAAGKLREAAKLAEDPGLRKYLQLREQALVTDDYRASDIAWLDMKKNTVDVVIGPIETYEDGLFGAKAAFEAYVLVKDKEWSQRLARYAKLLPELQQGLPVPLEYKREKPGTDSDLNAYDVVFYAGDCNAGSKTIAINLPNDEQIQLRKGTRRLQLKNAMRAKFDKILVPIADVLIAQDQRKHIKFDAFFADTMFHEVAHGLGIKRTVNGKSTVREALKDQASGLEEGKADILGLYMITKLHESGEYRDTELMDNYVTFLAGILRSVRFGASSAHGVANLVRFNYFEKAGAFARDEKTDTYRVNIVKMQLAMISLLDKILRMQGDGDYAAVAAFTSELGAMSPALKSDLERLAKANIPVDIVFEQGNPF